ncbi:hypothetical protein [Kitasatospora sp. NPDC004272]
MAAFLFGSGAFIFSTLAGSNSGKQWEYISYGIVTTGLTVLVGSVETRRARILHKKIEALARQSSRELDELVSGLAPGTSFAASISAVRAGAPQLLSAERGRLDQAIAAAASRVHPSSRGMYFSWDPALSTFVCRGRSVHSASPVVKISSGDFGFSHLKSVLNTGRVYRRTLTKSFFRGNVPGSKPDDALVMVRVQAGNNPPLGILAVDAKMDSWDAEAVDTPGYDDRHVRQVLVLADLLASGLDG